ncbi:uncharacterized protein V1518DRAFT_412135 [Limtongia smithiae]|uniref:uncharacterized protein n=1 Tax=Limtongia smithiae TaxID=1125753 RepID=UPI0034CF25E2
MGCTSAPWRRYAATILHAQKRAFSTSKIVQDTPRSQYLAPPQYNLRHLTANPELYISSCIRRRLPKVAETIPAVLELYQATNSNKAKRTEVYSERKKLHQQLGKNDLSAEDRKLLLDRLNEVKVAGTKVDDEIAKLEAKISAYMDSVPNLLPDDCPRETEEVVKYLCSPPEKGSSHLINDDQYIRPIDFEETRPDHVDIGNELGLLDLTTASIVSGHAFYYLIGDGALLEQALVQFALSMARQHGFKVMMPPSVVRREYAMACGFRPRDADGERQIYNLSVAGGTSEDGAIPDDGTLCLTGTAEIPLASWASNKTFESAQCPVKIAGVSRSYRAEAGARGRDTRGIYRVHEFTKVELFAWVPGCTETESYSENMLEELRDLQESIITQLGLHCRVLNMPSTDLGASAYKKYDIEAWMPGRQSWGEVTSASNCLDYQARRLHTKVRMNGKTTVLAHTLNGTALAVPRVIVAILENFYDPERKAVWIPKPLRKYMDDRAWITKED